MTSTTSNDANIEKEVLVEMLLCSQYGWKQHPQLKSYETCKICIDDLHGKYVLETACGHYFDHSCVMETVIKYGYLKCPDCSKEYVKIPNIQ